MAINGIKNNVGPVVRPTLPAHPAPQTGVVGIPARGVDSFSTITPRPLAYTPPTVNAARFGAPLTRDQVILDQALATVPALDGDPRGRFVARELSAAVKLFVS